MKWIRIFKDDSRIVCVAVLIGLLLNSANISLALFMKNMINIENFKQGNWVTYASICAIIIFAIYVLDMSYLNLTDYLLCKLHNNMKTDLYNQINNIKLEKINSINSGQILSNITGNMDELCELIFQKILRGIIQLLYCIIVFVILFSIDVSLTIFLIFFIFFFTFYSIFIKKKLVIKTKEYLASRELLYEELNDIVNAKDYINGMNLIDIFLKRVQLNNKFSNDKYLKMNILTPCMQSSIEMATMLSYIYVFICMIYNHRDVNHLIYINFLTQLWSRYGNVIDLFYSCVKANALYERIINCVDGSKFQSKGRKSIVKLEGDFLKLDLCNVTYKYENSNILIHNLTYTFRDNGLYRINGKSGSGKSTLFLLILGLLDMQQGEIYINKVNAKDISHDILIKIVGMVHQEPYIVIGNFYENIIMGDMQITVDDVNGVIDNYKLSSYMNTLMKKDCLRSAVELTSFQKKLIDFIRVLVRRQRIMLLDEVFADLSNNEEKIMEELVKRLSKEKICIFVSHKECSFTYRNIYLN